MFPMKQEPNSPGTLQLSQPSPEQQIWDTLADNDQKQNFKVS